MNRQSEQRRRQTLKRKRRNCYARWLRAEREAAMYAPVKARKRQIRAAQVRRQIELWHVALAAKRLEQVYGHTNKETP